MSGFHANSVRSTYTEQTEMKCLERQCQLLEEEKHAVSEQIELAKPSIPVDRILDLLQEKRKLIQAERLLVEKQTCLELRLTLERKRCRSRSPEGPSSPTKLRKQGQGYFAVENNFGIIDLTNE